MRLIGSFVLVPLLIVFATASAYCDTVSTFTGGNGVNWSTAANWTPATVPNNSPGTGYDVAIGSPWFVAVDISPTVNSLTLNGGLMYAPAGIMPRLTVVNDANLNGAFWFGAPNAYPPQPGGFGAGSLTVGGNLNIGGSGPSPEFFVQDSSLTVGGNLTNSASNAVILSNTGNNKFSVGGTLTNQAGAQLYLGNDRCFGPLQPSCPGLNPPTAIEIGPTTTAGKIVNNGTIFSWSNVTASSLINNGITSFIQGGASVSTLQNAGTIYLSNSCCSIAPEQTAGLIVGSGVSTGSGYQQLANGVLQEVLSSSTSYGTIMAGPWAIPPNGQLVGYPIDLDGTLDIMLANGFVPTIGESFTILSSGPGDLSGAFSNVSWDSFDNGYGYFLVGYDYHHGDVVITAEMTPTPEPTTALTLIPALAFVFWGAYRRRSNA